MMFGRGIEAVVDVSFGGLAVGIMLLGRNFETNGANMRGRASPISMS